MKIKLDENLPVESKGHLTAVGHDVLTVYDQDWAGMPDEQLVPGLAAEGRLLLTMDKGIANIRHFPPEQSAGTDPPAPQADWATGGAPLHPASHRWVAA